MLERLRRSPLVVVSVATLAVSTDSLVYGLLVPVLPNYLEAGASSTDVGVLLAVFAAALLVTTPLVGLLVDRIGSRLPMFLGLLGLACATVLLGLAETMSGMIAARVFQGVGAAMTATSSLALIAQTMPAEKRGWAMGVWTTGSAAGTLLGPPIGGLLYESAGRWGPLAFAAALALIDGLARVLLVEPTVQNRASPPALRRFFRNAVIVDACAVALVGAVGLTVLEATLPLHVQASFEARPAVIGALFTAATLAFGAVAPIAGLLEARLGHLKVSVVGLALFALALPAVAVAHSLLLTFCAVILVGGAIGLTVTPTMPALAEVVDKMGGGAYGIAYSLYNTAFAVGMMLGPIGGSLAADALDFKAALLWISAFTFSAACVLWHRLGTRDTATKQETVLTQSS